MSDARNDMGARRAPIGKPCCPGSADRRIDQVTLPRSPRFNFAA